jgi:hypothetical protein
MVPNLNPDRSGVAPSNHSLTFVRIREMTTTETVKEAARFTKDNAATIGGLQQPAAGAIYGFGKWEQQHDDGIELEEAEMAEDLQLEQIRSQEKVQSEQIGTYGDGRRDGRSSETSRSSGLSLRTEKLQQHVTN